MITFSKVLKSFRVRGFYAIMQINVDFNCDLNFQKKIL